MKTINLTDEQFDTLYEFVDNKVESIVNASVDYNDSEILNEWEDLLDVHTIFCLLYTSPSPRDERLSRMPSSA